MTSSENGWEPAQATEAECEWITVPGTSVTLELLKGWPATIMGAYAADYNAYVEPLRDPDSAGWTPTNSVATSNHLNGTAMDLNWNSHPFQVSYAGYSPDMIATVRDMLAFYEGTMFWGQDWDGNPFDCMHHQMGYNSFGNPHTQDFINRKIRADGFSTYRRGDAPPPPLSRADGYALAIIQEGQRRGITPRGIQIALATGLVESNLTNYANSNDPASLQLPHDAVGSDGMSVGIFQQQDFPEWGPLACRMDAACSAGTFYEHLTALPDNYNDTSQSPGHFAQEVQRSAFPNRYDARFGDAVALYNRLAGTPPAPPPAPPGDDMALVPQEQWDMVFHGLTDRVISHSPFRHLGEGAQYTVLDLLRSMDGNEHVQFVELLASLGHGESIALLQEVASADPVQYPDRQWDAHLARGILSRLPTTAPGTPPALMPPAPPRPPALPPAPQPAPTTVAPLPNGAPVSTTGQLIGKAFDALEALRLADALPIEERAPLAALISVLQTKNGSQL